MPVVDAAVNGDDPVVYMLRQASKKRQFSDDQRAMIANDEREWLAVKNVKERKQKQAEGGKKGGRGHRRETLADDADAKVSREDRNRSDDARESAARAHNVSPRKVQRAHAVKRADPELGLSQSNPHVDEKGNYET